MALHHKLRAAVAPQNDPYWGNVSLLLSGNGTNGAQNNTFVDSSTNNFTITRNGNTTQGSLSPFAPVLGQQYSAEKHGGSGYFDGSGDYLTFTGITLSSDFCCECWFYKTANPTQYSVIFGGSSSGGNGNNHQLFVTNTGGLTLVLSATVIINSAGTAVTNNTWNHLAWVRSGTNCAVFVNGVRQGTATSSIATSVCSRIGDIAGLSGYQPFGYISNARIVAGSSVYDPTATSFTPPTSPLTAITNTSLLLNFTNAGIIDSTAKNDLETVGNAQISTSVKKYGTGSLAFDGTGDWLLIQDNADLRFGTGNFTIECWLYLGATGSARGIVAKGTSTTGWLLSTNTSNQVVFTYGSSTITSTGSLSGSTWYHLAVVRSGTGTNQVKIYIDGTNDGTGTVSTDFNQTNNAYVGADRTGGSAMNGNIADLRLTKFARYTANFTPPQQQLPSR